LHFITHVPSKELLTISLGQKVHIVAFPKTFRKKKEKIKVGKERPVSAVVFSASL